jgi:hypothetical protein
MNCLLILIYSFQAAVEGGKYKQNLVGSPELKNRCIFKKARICKWHTRVERCRKNTRDLQRVLLYV